MPTVQAYMPNLLPGEVCHCDVVLLLQHLHLKLNSKDIRSWLGSALIMRRRESETVGENIGTLLQHVTRFVLENRVAVINWRIGVRGSGPPCNSNWTGAA